MYPLLILFIDYERKVDKSNREAKAMRGREVRGGITSRAAGDMESKMEAVKQEEESGETYNSMAVSNEKDLGDGDDSEQPSDYVEYQGLMTRQKAIFSKSLLHAISL